MTAINQVGNHISAASATMHQPSAQMMMARDVPKENCHAKWKYVSSRKTSQSPRDSRKRESWPRVFPRCNWKCAPVPANNIKTGAQRCVTQRVR